MGDCLWTGKPSLYVINNQGQLKAIPLEYVNPVPTCMAKVKAGRAHPCQVAGNTV